MFDEGDASAGNEEIVSVQACFGSIGKEFCVRIENEVAADFDELIDDFAIGIEQDNALFGVFAQEGKYFYEQFFGSKRRIELAECVDEHLRKRREKFVFELFFEVIDIHVMGVESSAIDLCFFTEFADGDMAHVFL